MTAIRGIVPMLLAVLLAGCAHHPAGSSPDTGSIAGRVLDSHGVGVWRSRVTVTGIPGPVFTQGDGGFLISNVPAGTHIVTASAAGTDVNDSVRVAEGKVSSLTLRFKWFLSIPDPVATAPPSPSGTIRGTVVEDKRGTPLQYANVIILGAARGTQTGPDGSFSIVVPVGTYAIRVKNPGYAQQTGDYPVQVKEGQTTTVHFKLKEVFTQF